MSKHYEGNSLPLPDYSFTAWFYMVNTAFPLLSPSHEKVPTQNDTMVC